MKVWVSGSLAFDRVMDYDGRFADHLNPKKIHVVNLSFAVRRLELSYGGTAGNIAYNLALLGMPTGVVGNLGRDGKDYERLLRKRGLDIQNVQILKNNFTAGAYIITDRADNQIAGFFSGAMMGKSLLPKSSEKDWAIVAADFPLNMTALASQYRKRGTRYIFDPGQQITALKPTQLLAGIMGAAVIIGNDYEMDLILRRSKYKVKPNQFLVTTLGEKGSLIVSAGKKLKIPPAKPRKVVDPTGAGDAYRAGLIFGLVKGYSLEKTGRLASCVAVCAVEKYGTQNHQFTLGSIKNRFFKIFKQAL